MNFPRDPFFFFLTYKGMLSKLSHMVGHLCPQRKEVQDILKFSSLGYCNVLLVVRSIISPIVLFSFSKKVK